MFATPSTLRSFWGFTLLALVSWSCQPSSDGLRERTTEVLVVGGGASGVAAALQAARSGAQVVLVEETTWLGGMVTAAGVSATDGNHRLPSGIWGEFRQRLYDHYGGPDSVETGWVSNTLFEPSVGNKIWHDLLAAEPNITLIDGYRPVKVSKEQERISQVTFVGIDADTLIIKPRVTIEATELGDIVALAKADYRMGQDPKSLTLEEFAPETANANIQDLTFTLILQEYSSDQTIEEPPGYDPQEFNCACKELCDDPDFEVVDCQTMMQYGRLPNDKYMINWPINGNDYYVNSLEMSYQHREDAYELAKLQSLRFLYHLQTKAGFTNLGIAQDEFPTEDRFPLIPYHRESRRTKGVDFLTVNHLKDPYNYSLYRDAIAVGDYPLDHHHDKNALAEPEEFPAIPSFSIPYGCLIPEVVDGLIVAEKSISVSHMANGATRLQPCVMLIGQAAGAAAALSVQQATQPRDLDISLLQQQLLDAGCWLMPFLDITPADSIYFQPIQRVGLAGLMHGTGVPYKWANQTWFYADSAFYFSDWVSALEAMGEEQIPEFEEDRILNRWEFVMMLLILEPPNITDTPGSDLTPQGILYYAYGQGWFRTSDSTDIDRAISRKEAAYILDNLMIQ